MKRLIATLSGVAGVLAATCIAYSPPALADTCPYDMSTPAGQQAVTDATVAASNQVRANEAAMGTTGSQALSDQSMQIEADNSRMILACSGKASPVSDQALNGADQAVARDQAIAQQQAAEQAAMNAPPPPDGPAGMDCAGMDESVNSAGPLNDIANRLSGGLLGKIQSAPLAVCGATNAAIGVVAPNDFNQTQTVTGFCDAANQAFNPISGANPCGNTPAG